MLLVWLAQTMVVPGKVRPFGQSRNDACSAVEVVQRHPNPLSCYGEFHLLPPRQRAASGNDDWPTSARCGQRSRRSGQRRTVRPLAESFERLRRRDSCTETINEEVRPSSAHRRRRVPDLSSRVRVGGCVRVESASIRWLIRHGIMPPITVRGELFNRLAHLTVDRARLRTGESW